MTMISSRPASVAVLSAVCLACGCAGEPAPEVLDPAWAWVVHDTAPLMDGGHTVGTLQREWVREGWRDWRCFDVLAAAYAQCGEFQEAVAWQEVVVSIAPEERKPELEHRLSLYRSGEPFRMAPHAP